MPFDGVVAKSVVQELKELLTGGRIEKIFQPEKDEIILNIRSNSRNYKLAVSSSANYPRIHITEASRENPQTPPMFCMLLRKHLTGGRITGLEFHDYERIIALKIEATNELGDLSEKKLIIEIMGRYSNIILVNQDNIIIDAIKHIDSCISSVREVMPAREYTLPPAQDKVSPEQMDENSLVETASGHLGITLEKYLLNSIKGFSPLLCREVCFRAGIDGKSPASSLSCEESLSLKAVLSKIKRDLNDNSFSPCLLLGNSKSSEIVDFHCIEIQLHEFVQVLPSISQVMDSFYTSRDTAERLKQKKSDIYRVLNNGIDRCNKKTAIYHDKLRDVADREKLKLFGELITANIHCIPENEKSISLLNYYSENADYVDISLDENLTPQKNAQRYYKQYTKAKNAFHSTNKQLEETHSELKYLESVLHLLDNCTSLQEIDEVRQELADQGYLMRRKRRHSKKQDKASSPLRFKSTDGYDIYVGKNNKQNDYLTLKLASSGDTWLHTKDIPGSHVIIKGSVDKVPDSTLWEAAMLSAFHSKARMSSTVPVDYTAVKYVKKPSGSKPGMVNYENYKTIIVTPDENIINKLKAE